MATRNGWARSGVTGIVVLMSLHSLAATALVALVVIVTTGPAIAQTHAAQTHAVVQTHA